MHNYRQYQASDKVIEIRQERARLRYTVTPYSAELREATRRREVEYEERMKPIREARRNAAIAMIIGQNAPKDIQSCECGAEACGSNSHSSWCQMFTTQLDPRKKTSFTPIWPT